MTAPKEPPKHCDGCVFLRAQGRRHPWQNVAKNNPWCNKKNASADAALGWCVAYGGKQEKEKQT